MCQGDVAVRDQLEVEDVERLARRVDQLVERARTPYRRIGQALQLLGERLATGEQRTGSQKFEEPPTVQCISAHLMIFPTKASHASICDLATNSLGWCACAMSPGPQMTVDTPWPRKMPASVP